jgi:hypothetical protein
MTAEGSWQLCWPTASRQPNCGTRSRSGYFRLPGRQEFLEKHQDILYPPVVTMGSPQPEIDAAAVRDSYKEHLLRLGLIEAVYRQPTPREPAEFDRHTGKLKSSYDNLTGLGSLLLDLIDDALPPVAA